MSTLHKWLRRRKDRERATIPSLLFSEKMEEEKSEAERDVDEYIYVRERKRQRKGRKL